MNNFRLKKQAAPFFKQKYATQIMPFDSWDDIGVDIAALEDVKEPYLSYGHKTSKHGSSLGGWGEEDGARYCFTIHFPSLKYKEHDEFSNGKTIRTLMDKIQNQLDSFFNDFVNQPTLKQ